MAAKERKPLIDERIPRRFREMIRELKGIRELLEEVKERLAVPPVVPTLPPVKVRLPPVITKAPVVSLTGAQFRELLVEANKRYGILTFSDDLYVETVDLSSARSEPTEFPQLKGLALTIYRNTGSFDLYINKASDDHKITVDALTYPQTFLLDWFRVKSLWIQNTAQSGKEAVLISWKRPFISK